MKLPKYLRETLEMGIGERRARFINEFSEKERAMFARALLRRYRQAGYRKADLLRDIPEAAKYLRPKD